MPTASPAQKSKLKRLLMILLLAAVALVTLGISSSDEAAFRQFDEAVDRWQTNPEFRAVAMDYCIGGSRAMRTRPFFIGAKTTIMAMRSVPGLPKRFAVNPTSAIHYEDFTRGALSAYLHLCSEQDVPDMVGIIEAAGRKARRTPADLLAVLDAYHMDFPVVHDAGAMASVEDLLVDTDAGKGFSIRKNIGSMLAGPIARIAADIHVPGNPADMSAEQQRAVFERLDGYLKAHDRQLWRTKQVSDLCGGVWAQVYGPPYRAVMTPFLVVKEICRWIVLGGLLTLIFGVLRRPTDGATTKNFTSTSEYRDTSQTAPASQGTL